MTLSSPSGADSQEAVRDNETGITPAHILRSTSVIRLQTRMLLAGFSTLAILIQLDEWRIIPGIASFGSISGLIYHYCRLRTTAFIDCITNYYDSDRPAYDAILRECRNKGGSYVQAANIVDEHFRRVEKRKSESSKQGEVPI